MALEEITLPSGEVVRLGNVMPTSAPSADWKVYGAVPQTPIISRADWPKLIAAYDPSLSLPGLPPVANQNGVGMCNASAACSAVEFLRQRQGLPYTQLSAADLYHRINWGRDGGSLLEDGMAELMKNGVGTVATSGYLWKGGHFKGEAPASERARFKVAEAYICPTFDHCMSAVLSGFAIVSGILWYSNYEPGADGWLPRGRGQAGGHALMGFKPAMRGEEFGIVHQNSWGQDWGKSGALVIPESGYDGPVGGWWCLRAAVDEGGAVPTPIN